MRGKATKSGEQVVIFNVYKYFKVHNPSESQNFLFKCTSEAKGSSISTVRRIVKQSDGPKTPGIVKKKRKIRIEDFSKLDEFDLSVIRRTVHGYFARNENLIFIEKSLNKLRDEIHFPYSITTLSLVLKMLGFKYKKRQRESVVHERADLVALIMRESFMRRIQEMRKNEPDREIVYTDETWLNAGHRIKKEWVDLEALQNPRRSIADYGNVGCTRDVLGRGKRLIIVDCITENGPIPGALRTFSTESKTKGKNSMIFNLLNLWWPKKEISKIKTQTKSRKIKCRKTRHQLQVKGKLTTTAVINIRLKRQR